MYNEIWSSFERKPLHALSNVLGGNYHWGYDTSNGRYLSELSCIGKLHHLCQFTDPDGLHSYQTTRCCVFFLDLVFCISLWMAYLSKNQFLLLSCICICLCKCLLYLSYRWSDHTSSSLVEKDKNHLEYSKVLRRLRKPQEMDVVALFLKLLTQLHMPTNIAIYIS